MGSAGEENDACGSVGLVEVEVEVNADVSDGNHPDEVDVKEMRLGSIRSD